MRQAIVLWWHRRVLRHPQTLVMNGPTEPGVLCQCRLGGWGYRGRWFPSDGGGGK